VVLFLGEEASLSGEAASRAYLDLPGAQEELAAAVAGAGKPVVTVIMSGRPLTFHNTAVRSGAVLYAWHPGTMGGPAIADVLLGDAVPSGRLPVTFPRTVGQVPMYYNHTSTGRPPAESNKFTSKYLDAPFTPEYPFGFGLSYTRFEYSNARVASARLASGGTLTVSADVANTGGYESDEIVQFYTRQLAATITRPVRELRAFRRIRLKPGEKRTVEFTLPVSELAFYGQDGKARVESGAFEAWVAPDAASGLKTAFEVTH
jgi:beta-glucosidase